MHWPWICEWDDPQMKKRLPWAHICKSCQGVLGSLMALWSKFKSHGGMKHIIHDLMSGKIYMQEIT